MKLCSIVSFFWFILVNYCCWIVDLIVLSYYTIASTIAFLLYIQSLRKVFFTNEVIFNSIAFLHSDMSFNNNYPLEILLLLNGFKWLCGLSTVKIPKRFVF